MSVPSRQVLRFRLAALQRTGFTGFMSNGLSIVFVEKNPVRARMIVDCPRCTGALEVGAATPGAFSGCPQLRPCQAYTLKIWAVTRNPRPKNCCAVDAAVRHWQSDRNAGAMRSRRVPRCRGKLKQSCLDSRLLRQRSHTAFSFQRPDWAEET